MRTVFEVQGVELGVLDDRWRALFDDEHADLFLGVALHDTF